MTIVAYPTHTQSSAPTAYLFKGDDCIWEISQSGRYILNCNSLGAVVSDHQYLTISDFQKIAPGLVTFLILCFVGRHLIKLFKSASD